MLREDIEYIVHCDEQGQVIGPISTLHAHMSGVRENLCHYSTWSMVYNPATGLYGIQLKSPKKHSSATGGKWDMGVAGHNCYVEKDGGYQYLDFEDNIQKEAEEEIGINVCIYNDLDEFRNQYKKLSSGSIAYIFDTFLYDSGYNKEWVGLGFIASCENNLHFNDGEVVDFQRLSPEKLHDFIVSNEANICAPLPMVFEKAEKFRKQTLE